MNLDLLSGLRVVESSAFIAAPLAGLTLAQAGADVIRIDLIGGGIDYARMPVMPGGRSLYWTGLNKGKRSLAVDIRSGEGRELVQALVTAPGAGAGVLLTNIGVPWLAHQLLAQQRVDLISCTIEGSSDGSNAVDYTVNCATGFPAITGGGSAERPVNHVLPAWDLACAQQAAFAIAAAAMRRQSSGVGAELRIALSDVAFSTLSHLGMLTEAELLQQERPSIGNDLYGAFGRDFATADGRRIFVAAISIGQWRSLVRACGLQAGVHALEQQRGVDLSREEQRYAARDAIAQLVEPWFAARSFEQAQRELDQHGACWGPYRTVREALAQDPRLGAANPVFETIHTAGVGEHRAAGSVVRERGRPRGPMRAAPLLGEHTDQILLEVLGLDSAAVGRLHDRGIVAGPDSDPLAPAARTAARATAAAS
ncbi:CoA transferase [Piscinibacter sakaiensis]|uniref:CoA transferase n=1 Tax=Piscinibacter sakaiensis TaxID=1547922 RepID=UPI003AAE6CDD